MSVQLTPIRVTIPMLFVIIPLDLITALAALVSLEMKHRVLVTVFNLYFEL